MSASHIISSPTLVCEQLLQKGNQLRRVILVWAGQVDVTQIEDDAAVVGRAQAFAAVGGDGLAAHLRQHTFGARSVARTCSAAKTITLST